MISGGFWRIDFFYETKIYNFSPAFKLFLENIIKSNLVGVKKCGQGAKFSFIARKKSISVYHDYLRLPKLCL